MKKIRRLVGISLVAAVVATGCAWPIVRADSSVMDDAHIARIRANCSSALSSLNRIHENDALLRVNRGQLYESISVKLMATLNSRIALNQLDGSKLSKVSVAYNNDLNAFRTSYQTYERQLSSAIQIDCTKQPIAFYDAVADARTKRDAVHTTILALNKDIVDYSNAFDEFNAAFVAASKEVHS